MLRSAIERNAWEEAERIAGGLLPLVAADQAAQEQGGLSPPERETALRAAQAALEAAKSHITPAYQSLKKLLIAWKRLPAEG